MQVGQPIHGELIYPVYADNKLVLPAKTIVTGSVTALHPNHDRRVSARLRADFTPFYTPVVDFNQIQLPDGTTLTIATSTATDGAPIYRLVAPPPRKGGFIRRQFDTGLQILHDQISLFTAPGKKDRLLRVVYSQLPWHPQNIEKGTAWTVETTTPFTVSEQPASPDPAVSTENSSNSSAWFVQAYLNEKLSSATSKQGEPIRATVAEPIYNPDHSIAVPQGATLVGTITQARPARRFGRAGVLHFNFRQLVLPAGTTRNVETTLTAADSAGGQNLAMNSEGVVKPKPQDKIAIPLLLAALAISPLHEDADDRGEVLARKNATASNSIGIIGFVVGIASGSANVAAGFGAYGTALALYNRWIKRGTDVTFVRDTRIVLQTTPRHAPVLSAQPSH
ncbi:hypothetical protein GCM10011507_30740 [Edaphobacter acidisoli]|uniref:Uncharacterized protein n=2 Tax=Edaphobacter acidisoli TaxID=2040573 RepID=A0A916RZ46_9BACT|nr:hypothetical protein GCM10011507_30740 [Edaphobacter acidisoli]